MPSPSAGPHWIGVVLALACSASAVHSQQATTTGVVRGVVRDVDGRPLPAATVIATDVETGVRRASVSDNAGRYQIPFLNPGRYVIRVQRLGYRQGVASATRIAVGDVEHLDLQLEPAAAQLQAVRVSARAGWSLIETQRSGVSARIDELQIARLPVNGRNFKDLIVLMQGVSELPTVGGGGSHSIGGGRTAASNLLMDGVNNNEQFFGGDARGGDRAPFSYSIEAIKEIQVILVDYDVERGSFTGGIVNAVTKSGTNDLRGSIFNYAGRSSIGRVPLAANDFNGNEPIDFRSQQYGLVLSGPIVKDRAHFLFALDRHSRREPRPVFDAASGTFSIGSPAFRFALDTLHRIVQIAHDSLGYDLSGEIGAFSLSVNETALFGRVDWQLDGRHTLTLRNNFVTLEQVNDLVNTAPSGPGDFLSSGGRYGTVANSIAGSLASSFGAGLTNELRVQWAVEDKPRQSNPAGQFGVSVPQVVIRNIGSAGRTSTTDVIFGSDPPLHSNRLRTQTVELIDNVRWTRGAHTFKVGLNVNGVRVRNDFFFNSLGTFTYSSLSAFAANRPSSFTRALPFVDADGSRLGRPVAEFHTLEGALYAQDEWQLTPKLFVRLGLRYDAARYQSNAPGNAALTAAFPWLHTDEAPIDANNVSPRIGFAFDVAGDGRQVVRGGSGLFYGRAPLVLVSNALLNTGLNQLSLMCMAEGTVPRPNFMAYAASQSSIPTTCVGGGAPSGAMPTVNVFSSDFQQAYAWKTSLGYDRDLLPGWRAGIEGLYSRVGHNYLVTDANLLATTRFLAGGHVPVFVEPSSISPSSAMTNRRASRVTRAFDQVLVQRSLGRATSVQGIGRMSRQTERSLLSASYTYDWTRDNGSRSCCQSGPDFFGGTRVAGDPNDVAAREGPADYNRTHTVALSALFDLPWAIQLSGIYRGFSGRPYTPRYETDVNGDGAANDRVYVPTDSEIPPMRLATAGSGASGAAAEYLGEIINRSSCLKAARGRFVGRNACRNPWQHVLDARAAKWVNSIAGQRVQVVADFFNILNGLNPHWGRRLEVSATDEVLLAPVAFDPLAEQYTYRVNTGFGRATPTQLSLNQQFQVQIGARYEF